MRFGASEGIRTLDVHLGKVMLYQTELRSLSTGQQANGSHFECKPSFVTFFEILPRTVARTNPVAFTLDLA